MEGNLKYSWVLISTTMAESEKTPSLIHLTRNSKDSLYLFKEGLYQCEFTNSTHD